MAQGCFVTGLFIEGAEWSIEYNSLVNSKPNILIEALPILAIIPTEKHQIQTKVPAKTWQRQRHLRALAGHRCNFCFVFQNTIVVPVYATTNRAGIDGSGLIFEAYLRNTDHMSKWILRGLCLVLNTDR